MNSPMLFGGIAEAASDLEPPSVNKIYQTFLHYAHTIWIHPHEREVPETAEALAAFNVGSLIPEYQTYVAKGGHVPTERGLTLEETWKGMQLPQSPSSTRLIPRQSERIVRPSNAEQRVRDLLLFCRDHDLLTEQGIKDLMTLYDNGWLFSRSADGHMTIDSIEEMAVKSFLQTAKEPREVTMVIAGILRRVLMEPIQSEFDLKQVLNDTLRVLADPGGTVHQ